MSPQQILRIIGFNETVPYQNLNDLILNTFEEVSFDVVIDEASKTSTVRQHQFQQMQQLFIQSGLAPDVYIPILLKYSDVSKSDQEEILLSNDLHKQMMQQKAELALIKKLKTNLK
jgi:hypothetical protein